VRPWPASAYCQPVWVLVSGFIIAFFLSFGIGANDVANTFGTSVGAKVISLRNACIIATIFEMLGASLVVMMDLVELEPRHWILFSGFLVSFVLAFGIGANDVANSFGTSVGSRVLTLRTACLLATIFEISGAVLLGYKVSDTIRKGIIDVTQYQDDPIEYMIGNLSALGGSAMWLIMATFLKMPISGTHSIVGAVLGFSIVARGLDGINWLTLGKIVITISCFQCSRSRWEGCQHGASRRSGCSSQSGSGSLSLSAFSSSSYLKLRRELTEGGRASLKNPDGMFTVGGVPASPGSSHDASPVSASLDDVRIKTTEPPSLQITDCSTDVDINRIADYVGKKEGKHLEVIPMDGLSPNSSAVPLIKGKSPARADESDDPEHPAVGRLFSFLQILTAAFGSFAHAGNDVRVCAAEGCDSPVAAGLRRCRDISWVWIWGRRVIKTMGEDLTKITPSSGFTIEIGAAITVLVASKIGFPSAPPTAKLALSLPLDKSETKWRRLEAIQEHNICVAGDGACVWRADSAADVAVDDADNGGSEQRRTWLAPSCRQQLHAIGVFSFVRESKSDVLT
ncbi:Sodium-dependent phosphate transporter 1-B, partial [Orchesella cincta]